MSVISKIEGFVVFDRKSQTFSEGGSFSSFSPRAKIWGKLSGVKAHLRQNITGRYQLLQLGAKLVGYEMRPSYAKRDCVVISLPSEEIVLYAQEFLREEVEARENRLS